jgi:hypothetical protein
MDPLDLAALFVRGLMQFFGWPFLSGCYPSGWLLAVATVISEKSGPYFLAAATVFTAQCSRPSRKHCSAVL